MRKIIQGLILTLLLTVNPLVCRAFSQYGPTMANEHLYRIAMNVLSSPELTIQQVMMAIFLTNQTAFDRDNINGLKSGYLLQIPPVDVMKKINQTDALKAIEYQNKVWFRHKHTPRIARKAVKQKSTVADVKEESNTELAIAKVDTTSTTSESNTATSLTDLSKSQTASATSKITAAAQPEAVNTSNTATSAATNSEVSAFMTDTRAIQSKLQAQIQFLDQQNQQLQTKVAQMAAQLDVVNHQLAKITTANTDKGQGTILLENLRKNAVGLSSGLLAMILLSYLLARTFKSKPLKLATTKDDMTIPSKLDLARAYVDMGDHSSARSVLQEVITKGNEEQRKGATDLLGKLNR